MFSTTSHKTFYRLLATIMAISILSLSFPTSAFASGINNGLNESNQTTISSANAPITVLPPTEANKATKSDTTIPSQSSVDAKDGKQSNGVFVKYASNMPKVDDTPAQFTPNNNLAQSSNIETVSDNDLIIDNATDSSVNLDITNTTGSSTILDTIPTTGSALNIDNVKSTTSSSTIYNSNNTTGSATSIDLSTIGHLPERNSDGAYPVKNRKSGQYSIGFTSQSGQDLLRFRRGNASLWMSPLNPASVKEKVNKNAILYENIYPSIDLRYTVEDSRLKEDLIINKPTGQKDFSFQLNLNNAGYQVMSDGTINFLEPNTGKLLFYMAKPFAVDKNGNRCDSVKLALSKDGLLMLSIDPTWLSQAVYPIDIDPTIFLPDAQFTRSSVAYTEEGVQVAANQPRFEAGKFGQAAMIEEGTTNLLTNNSFETDTSGWALSGAVTRSSGAAYIGSYSMALTNPAVPQGSNYTINGISPSTTYTVSTYVKNVNGLNARIDIAEYDSSGNNVVFDVNDICIPGTVNNIWTRYSKTVTTNSKTAKFIIRVICGEGGAQTGVCYLDCFQVEQKAYLTSFTDSTRAPETLSIPSTVFTKGNWSVEYTYIPQTADNKNVVATWGLSCVNGDWYRIIQYSSGLFQASVRVGGVEKGISGDPGMALSAKKPYTVCFTGDGSYLRLYVNGVQLETAMAYTESTSALSPNMFIGTDSDGNYTCNGLIDDLRISNRVRSAAEIQAAYNSNQPLPIDDSTTCKMGFDGNLQIASFSMINTGVTTIFTRSTTAYNLEGTQVQINQPRFEAGKFGQAVMIEEGTTNLLTNNSFETDTSGWVLSGAATRSSGAAYIGSYSMALTNPAVPQGSNYTISGISPSTTYTVSVYVKNVNGLNARIDIAEQDSSGNNTVWDVNDICIPGTVNNVWTRYSKTVTTNSKTAKFIIRVICGEGGAQTGVCYLDCFQVEQKAYLTSFTDSTRAPETLSIPSTVFTKGNWSVEYTYIPQTADNKNVVAAWGLSCVNGDWYRIIQYSSSGLFQASVSVGGVEKGISGDPGMALSAKKPYTVCFTGDGSYLRLYVNGVQIGTAVAYTEPTSALSPNMFIGTDCWGNYTCNGLIDDLRISNRVRSAAEVQATYNNNQPLPIDDSTTCKMDFDGNLRTTDIWGTGNQPYWNYTSSSLGGGFNTSVNNFNLNLLLSKSLFSIPGRGIPIGENITYNSIDGRNSSMGIGWHLGSDSSLTECEDGSVIYNQGDGGALQFTPNGSGGYNSPAGIYLTLQETSPGNYTITDKNQTVYTYQNGKPVQTVDRNGNTTTFTYDSNGRLCKLTDPSGRAITYSYNPYGQLATVADPANNTYQFTYQGNYLIGITDPANNTFTFAYDSNGHLSSFKDPLSRVTTYSFNPDGSLQYYRDARTSGQNVYQTTFAQTTVGNQLVTTVTDPGSHVYTYYIDSTTGNLQKYADQLGDTWQYTWTNNNLMSSRDANGTTSYTYDSNGNMLTKTTTVDSNSADNIIETMTYDNNNQLTKVVDGSGRVVNHQYDVKGNLLSTNNPNNKESNGKIYDQYGNVLQSSPMISSNQNLLQNGSFETGGLGGGGSLANWTHVPGGATITLPQGQNNTHGNYSLEMSSSTNVTDWYYQRIYGLTYGDKLTLRADVCLNNVQSYGNLEGAAIELNYGNGWSSWSLWGNGETPLIVTSQAANSYVDVYVGFYKTMGTAWFDGIQLEDDGNSNDGYILSAFNSVQNGGFENGLNYWNYTSGTPVSVANTAYQGADSAALTLSTSGNASIYQDVPVYSGEPLTFSGMVKTNTVSGTGAYYKIDYYNSSGQYLSTVQTGYVTGTQDFTELTCLATAPSGAYYGRLSAILNGSGTAYFDNVKLVPRTTQQYTFDSSGNYQIVSEDALGNQNKQTYNSNTGTISSSIDALNNTTNYLYDNLNQLVQVVDPSMHNAYYSYDGDNNLTVSRDPRSSSFTDNTYATYFTPNNLNQLNNLSDPLGMNTYNSYDGSANLMNVSLPNGLTINYEYDNANRMTKKTLDNGKYFKYYYDGANNLISVVDQNNNNYALSYDGVNRLANSTDSNGYTLGYQWDKSNNVISVTNTSTGNVNYTYGSDNRLTGVTLPDGNSVTYNYDENGRVFQARYPGTFHGNLNYRNIFYQPNGWVNTIEDPAFPESCNYVYCYNNDGSIYSISSWAGWDYYYYDSNKRLYQWYFYPVSGNPIGARYSYDAAGNITSKVNSTYDSSWNLLSSTTQNYSVNKANQITNTGFSYDNNGNMTSDGVYTYQYDAENKLTQVTGNGLNASYTYYYNGLRKSKTVNGVTTNFDWDVFGRLVRESDANGNTLATYCYDSNGNLVSSTKNGETYLYHTNQRGDVVTVADYSGNIVAQYNYDPWGNQTSYSGTLVQPFTYAGYYYDSETGLYYLKNRYYSAALGRFLTEDVYSYIKHENPQTLNLYAYAINNPINNVDPSGHDAATQTITLSTGAFIGQFILDGVSISTITAISAIAAPVLITIAAGVVTYEIIKASQDSSDTPEVEYPGDDPTKAPDGYEWKGKPDSTPGDKDGNWTNPQTGESLRPDLNHSDPIPPHWDYRSPDKRWWRVFPDGQVLPKD